MPQTLNPCCYCLQEAAASGKVHVIKLLLEEGADVAANNSAAIKAAVREGHERAVQVGGCIEGPDEAGRMKQGVRGASEWDEKGGGRSGVKKRATYRLTQSGLRTEQNRT